MFNIFKKKSPLEKLEAKHVKLLEEWHKLSSVNRTASDLKFAEAQEVSALIEDLKSKQ